MRGKRSKQYRKLMQQYGLSFGFREPYQVLVDAEMIRDADRFKMDLVSSLERTLHGQVKPMITQCSMRHLYALSQSPNPDPSIPFLISKAKTYERRRCNHLPEDYPVPLSTASCLSSVVDPKDNKTNKHRYVVASQDLEVRKAMRGILSVPLVYVSRSIMIMEPMADQSTAQRDRGERGKFREGIRSKGRGSGNVEEKRQRDEEGEGEEGEAEKKKIRRKGPKGPNPLSVKKPKKRNAENDGATVMERKDKKRKLEDEVPLQLQEDAGSLDLAIKKKRKRKHKSAGGHATAAAEEVGDDE